MKPIRFHPEAAAELLASATFYEQRAHHLGDDYLRRIAQTYVRLQHNPGSGRAFGQRRLRRILVTRFPYALIYQERDECIVIVAVMHMHRRSGYWKDRLT